MTNALIIGGHGKVAQLVTPRLITAGLAVTSLATGFFIYFVLGARIGGAGLTLLGCFLLAVILSSTDSPSVFSVLRSKRLTLRENLDPVLELESGSNDPMAYTLTLILVSVVTSSDHLGLAGGSWLYGAFIVAMTALWQILSGFAIGLGVGFGARWLMRRFTLSTGPLHDWRQRPGGALRGGHRHRQYAGPSVQAGRPEIL